MRAQDQTSVYVFRELLEAIATAGPQPARGRLNNMAAARRLVNTNTLEAFFQQVHGLTRAVNKTRTLILIVVASLGLCQEQGRTPLQKRPPKPPNFSPNLNPF